MITLEQWLQEQTRQGRHLYLVLDSDGQLDERNGLVSELGVDHYRNLYRGTPADSLANVAPCLFRLDTVEHPTLQALLKTPDRHWGWFASAASADLDALTAHWQKRLVTGERPNQALYRFHDNRVLGRALAYLQPEQRADYLGLMTSVCYWQAEQWTVTDNPDPGIHPLPTDPAWCHIPTPDKTFMGIQFDNTRRYLVREHFDTLLDLAREQDIDAWLRGQLDLAHTWGWQGPDSIHFLLMQNLQASDYNLPLLYTYGAPRAADQTFVEGASALTHHRMVNNNDPIPSVPGTGMDTKPMVFGTGLAVSFANAPLGISIFFAGVANLSGAPYAHHGKLHHFMPVRFEDGIQSQILWEPDCESITNKACNEMLQQKKGLPTHRAFEPSLYVLNHLMVGGYISNSWATQRHWQESQEFRRERVTQREFEWVDDALLSMDMQLRNVSREARPDAYLRAHEKEYDALRAEMHKMQVTRVRLNTLRFKIASEAEVYGNLASHPDLRAHNVPRWKAHPVNTAPEQLAMAPPAANENELAIAAITGVRIARIPFNFDIDSFS